MRVYDTDYPHAMIREAIQAGGCKTTEDVIWELENSHEDARSCIRRCDKAVAELRAGDTEWLDDLREELDLAPGEAR